MTTKDETYNGWTNRATWLMSMYLDGNYDGEGMYQGTRQHVDMFNGVDGAVFRLAEALEYYVDVRMTSDIVSGIVTDMLGYALAQVNWQEIATNLLEES